MGKEIENKFKTQSLIKGLQFNKRRQLNKTRQYLIIFTTAKGSASGEVEQMRETEQ